MGFFNVARQVEQVLKRERNYEYVTECHGRVVGTSASHNEALFPNV